MPYSKLAMCKSADFHEYLDTETERRSDSYADGIGCDNPTECIVNMRWFNNGGPNGGEI